MKKITFNIPTVDGPNTAEGYRVWLHCGPHKRAFMLQMDTRGRPCMLTDFASGYRLVDLSGDMLARYVRNPYAFRGSTLVEWRDLAQDWLDRIIEAKGCGVVMSTFKAVPVINGAVS